MDEVQNKIINRLKTAEGHLQAVTRMAVAGEPCEEILHQLGAVEAALNATGRLLLSCQLQKSVAVMANSPDLEVKVAEIERLSALYQFAGTRPARKQRHKQTPC